MSPWPKKEVILPQVPAISNCHCKRVGTGAHALLDLPTLCYFPKDPGLRGPDLNSDFLMPPFISFEGLDGCGKTTQVRLLADYLTHSSIPVAVLREPGGTPTGEAIRTLLLSSRNRGLLPLSELLLYYAARNQNLCQKIIPALAGNKWVLCDRFADASAAYQGYGRGLDLSLVKTLDSMVNRGRKPDLTLLIDIEPSLSLARARGRNRRTGLDEGRFESESLAFFHRIREGYLAIAAREPDRIRILNGSQTIEKLQKEIRGLISTFLPKDRSYGME